MKLAKPNGVGKMSKSSVAEQPVRTLADLDAFVDGSIDAKSDKELSTFEKVSRLIMRRLPT